MTRPALTVNPLRVVPLRQLIISVPPPKTTATKLPRKKVERPINNIASPPKKPITRRLKNATKASTKTQNAHECSKPRKDDGPRRRVGYEANVAPVDLRPSDDVERDGNNAEGDIISY